MKKIDNQNMFFVFMGAIFTLSLTLKIAFISEPIASDDLRYFEFAKSILTGGGIDRLDHAASRIVFLIMVGLPGVLFSSIQASGVFNVLIVLATEAIVAAYCFRNYGLSSAMVGLSFTSLSGIALTYSGYLLPDPLLGFFWLCACLSLLVALSKDKFSNQLLSLSICGIFTGLSYSAKDTGILLAPLVAIIITIVLLRKFNLRASLLGGIVFSFSFIFIWLIESFSLYLLSGEFFYKTMALSEVHNQGDVFHASSFYEFLRQGWWNLSYTFQAPFVALSPILVSLVSVFLLYMRRDVNWLLSLIASGVLFYLVFGTSSPSELINLPFQERYIQPILPLSGICIAGIYNHYNLKAVRIGLVFFIFICSFIGLKYTLNSFGNLYFQTLISNAKIGIQIVGSEENPVYADCRIQKAINFSSSKSIKSLVLSIPVQFPLPPGYYILDPNKGCIPENLHNKIKGAGASLIVGIELPFSKDEPRYKAKFYKIQ